MYAEDQTINNPELMEAIEKYENDLNIIKSTKIKQLIPDVYKEARIEIFKAAIPSFVLFVLSFFVGVADVPFLGNVFESISLYINPSQQVLNTQINPVTLWWFPVIIYLIFIIFALITNKRLKEEFERKNVSEASITRVIDRYSGIVDGLGTALPLLGAAILLISIEKGPAVFLGFAVPFEIKSILILAIAKLFDSVFDALALKYQKILEVINNVERAYSYNNQSRQLGVEKPSPVIPAPIVIESSVTKEEVDKIYETMKASHELGNSIKGLVSELNNLKLPEEKTLKDMQVTSASLGQTIKFLGDTLDSFKDSNVSKSLENLVTLLGKKEK
ncbi:MAG: hypothetical protein ABI792_04900 [bacterium]